MSQATTLIFNIIYVRGTVQPLLPMLSTLLAHSTCQYRMVSNACLPEEEALLQRYAAVEPQLHFYSLNTQKIASHHEAMHELLRLDDGPYFAMMDSDIFATAPFEEELLQALEQHKAVFTGLPIWHEHSDGVMPADFRIMGGRFYKAHNDMMLGMTYCAIYHKAPLQTFIQEQGINLASYTWSELPKPKQDQLKTTTHKPNSSTATPKPQTTINEKK